MQPAARPATRRKPHTPSLLLLALAASCLAASVHAAELPKRKPGLWELNTQMEGMPSIGAIQQCIDASTDDLMMQKAAKEKHQCSVFDIRMQGNKATVHSVCKVEGSTATTDASFVGAFDSAYKGRMYTRFSPPMHGIGESRMTLDARWIGPCKPGQKPGDVTMPSMGEMNINEMLKDPRIQEMMKDPRVQEILKQQQQ